ncbi:glycosyltransferase [Desemzia incerta]|uniref:glycosyltransferase n=1 Tax=Desemzia incerta TaxID=82801 RepID=UPI0024C2E534|nr:glycosyltransferase [Desemzia incerta]WHZ31957.1 glycosyltransferase [Desemzia incerta]
MMHQPLVSVIVPVYNVENYIEECLDSIIEQTYSNLEIIVIDDGSTDCSNQKVRLYTKDERVQLIEQANQGLSGARNTGLKVATGKYVLFVDSDDYIERTTVEELVTQMETHRVDLIRFNGKAFVDEMNTLIEQNHYDFSHRLEEGKVYKGDSYEANRCTFVSPVYLYIIRRNVLEQHNITFYEQILHEDELFTTQVFLVITSMMYQNKFYYHRRYRENSIMTDQNPKRLKKTLDSYDLIYKELAKLYAQKRFTKEQKKLIKRQMLSIYSGVKNSSLLMAEKGPILKQMTAVTAIDKTYLKVQRAIRTIKQKQT